MAPPPPEAVPGVEDIDGALQATSPLSVVAPRRFGQTDLTILPLALGGAHSAGEVEEAAAHTLLDRFRALGGTLIDTADDTAEARAWQAAVGRWRPAEGMLITARVGHSARPGSLDTLNLRRAVDAALKRLGRERIDVLYLDGEDGRTPLAESLTVAERLIDAGKVRYLGASHVTAERLMEARVLASTGLPRFVAVQSDYGLLRRGEFEAALCIVCAGQELAVCPTASLEGITTGRSVARGDVAFGGRKLFGRRFRALAALRRIAAEQGAAPAAVAVAWLLAKRGIVAPVVAATAPEDLDGLMAACAIRLTRAHLRELDMASARPNPAA
jgi:aryl-alcohol dehydrogenase-like predicted oxidoreductase